jgi:hypothetical protein
MKPIRALVVISLILFLSMPSLAQKDQGPQMDDSESSYLLIKKITPFHCQRGPQSCENCRKLGKEEKFCLLRIYTSSNGMVARPVMQTEQAGVKSFNEYDLVKIFDSRKLARRYAKKNKITFDETK